MDLKRTCTLILSMFLKIFNTAESSSYRLFSQGDGDNRKITDDIFMKTSATSLVECSLMCLRFKGCDSINYLAKLKEPEVVNNCELSGALSYVTGVTTSSVAHWHLYSGTSVINSLLIWLT